MSLSPLRRKSKPALTVSSRALHMVSVDQRRMQLALHTVYDGDFDAYIEHFAQRSIFSTCSFNTSKTRRAARARASKGVCRDDPRPRQTHTASTSTARIQRPRSHRSLTPQSGAICEAVLATALPWQDQAETQDLALRQYAYQLAEHYLLRVTDLSKRGDSCENSSRAARCATGRVTRAFSSMRSHGGRLPSTLVSTTKGCLRWSCGPSISRSCGKRLWPSRQALAHARRTPRRHRRLRG